MKIVYISFSFIPSRTANSLHVMKMCQAFSKNGHDVHLLVPDKQDEYEDTAVDIFNFYQVDPIFKVIRVPFPKIKGKLLVFWALLIYQLLKLKPDLVYGRYISGIFFAANLGISCIYEAHSVIWHEAKRDKRYFAKLINHKNFRYLVVISEKLKEAYMKNRLIDNSKVIVAHDGADIPLKQFASIDWPGRKNVLQVGFVGHLYKGKGMEIIHAIVQKLLNIDFHIVGGYEKDIAFWKSKISSDNVYFHGFVPQDQLGSYINKLDICLLPNQKKVNTHGPTVKNIGDYTSPLKLFDYMAHKKTIIASNLPVLREVLKHNENAWLCPSDDPQAWIDALCLLEKDKTLRTKLAEGAFQDFVTHYTWNQRAVNVLS